MDSTATNKPKTIAEMLPGLGCLLSKDAMQSLTLTATKKPQRTIVNTRTSEKVLKPMTIAEMRTEMKSLLLHSPKNNPQASASVKKKWNSSCKLDKKIVSRTANGQINHNSVRKTLNFQPPRVKAPKFANSRITMMNSETPKFPKPEIKNKKQYPLQACSTVRISGVCNIAETPAVINKPIKSRMTLTNKENISNQPNTYKKLIATPKSSLRKRVMARVPDTPLSNESSKSSCDASFLQNERDIEYIENKNTALANEPTLDNIAEVTPPASTPFMNYRNGKDYYNNSSDVKEETCQNETIMCFDNTVSTENGKREDSVIVSLCDMLNKAAVTNSEKYTKELNEFLEVQKHTAHNIKMIENAIQTLNSIKESHLKSLQSVNKLIQEKRKQLTSESDKENTILPTKEEPNNENKLYMDIDKSEPCSVIKKNQNSPSYKIPKKYTCIRKKVFHKSLPNISGVAPITPLKPPGNDMGEKALSMYMQMKERNNYLTTPLMKQRPMEVPDTPSITSHNLQMQLDKLYSENRYLVDH